MGFCACIANTGNTGVGRQTVPGKAVRHIYVSRFADDGTKNGIAESDLVNGVLESTFVAGKLNEADPSKRWYPTPGLFKNITPSQNDDITESFNDGSSRPVSEGNKLWNAMLLDLSPAFKGQLEKAVCDDPASFEITVCGDLEGVLSDDGTDLFPKPISKETFRVRFVDATDTTKSNTQIDFEYDSTYQDEDRRQINSDDSEDDFLLTADVGGLRDILPEVSSITATGFVFDAETVYWSEEAFEPIVVEGLLITDFALVDSAGVTITITTVTESLTVPGLYTFVIPSTPADVLTLTLDKPSGGTGYAMEAQTIVTP